MKTGASGRCGLSYYYFTCTYARVAYPRRLPPA
jgi:hypothetical protein